MISTLKGCFFSSPKSAFAPFKAELSELSNATRADRIFGFTLNPKSMLV
ncbi:hypothetical protein FM113_09480 [Leucobacter sp. 7(1)]|nr:hypothetical protein FM113_09480 [Leucobacter sp. 7(1)]